MSRRRHRVSLPSEPVLLKIERLSHEGRGVARHEGKVAFVEGALPGETVMAVYTGRRRQFDELRIVELLQASPQRVTPPCEYFGLCGGCAMQHLDPVAQRHHKEAVLLEHLRHQAGLGESDFQLLGPLAGDSDTGYRRKARLAARYVQKKGGALLGFRERQGSFITDMGHCEVLVPAAARLISPLRALLSEMDRQTEIPQIEVAVGERDGGRSVDHVALVLRHLTPLTQADRERLRSFGLQYRIDWYLQSGGPDSVIPLDPDGGSPRLHYHLPQFGLKLGFHPLDFTQVNGDINRRMVATAIDLLELRPDHRVLDLFCGLGNFTLAAATRCALVNGVEGSAEMVARAEENAFANDIGNAAFHAADLSSDLTGQPWTLQHWDRILLDPPRSGAAELVPLLGESKAEKIVYISCNPLTLARDASALIARGYRLERAGIMDMFPHTAHVESIAEFVRDR